MTTFPAHFLWGVATAGHQSEGDNRGSDTWFAEHVTPTVFREPSGRACNSFELWREDVDLAAGLGLNAYRFSVEWARVEPAPGAFASAAIDHYQAITDYCLERGLAPVVTFNHFTSPHWFAARGGWLADDAPDMFAHYCERIASAFGDRIAYALTLNEPNLPKLLSWSGLPDFVRDLERATLDAAGRAAGVARYRLSNVVLAEEMDAIADGMTNGHRAAREAIRAIRGDLPVGFSLAVVDDRVVGDDATVRDRKRAEVYGRWLDLAREDQFIGVQNYEYASYDAHGAVGQPDAELFASVDSASLAGVARYVASATGVPVFVTEHGMATPDDARRCVFLEDSLSALAGVVRDGVPLIGYCHWTLLDNFEWIFGYGPKLGLFAVDAATFRRIPKPSAQRYAAFVRSTVSVTPAETGSAS
ncbi:MAG TPA: family 1 glycosylhydrolase [Jatrophihabitantaceae bacterium]